ncbi:MAG: SHD1 domain-containing protein [Pirellulaceae bacterium]
MSVNILPTLLVWFVLNGSQSVDQEEFNKLFYQAGLEMAETKLANMRARVDERKKVISDIAKARNVEFDQAEETLLFDPATDTWKLHTRDRESHKLYVENERAHFQTLTSQLESLATWELPTFNVNQMRVGSVGIPFERTGAGAFLVSQVLSEKRLLIAWSTAPFILEGPDFGDVRAEQLIEVESICMVVGTEPYENADGDTQTVFVIKVQDPQIIKEAMQYAARHKPKKPWRLRTWTDATGKYSVEAELITATRDAVKLRKTTGIEITVALSKLSVADREFANDHVDP